MDERRTTLSDELQALQAQHREAEEADRQRLAEWMVTAKGERPQPTAPAVVERIDELRANLDALQIAAGGVLEEKESFVARNRSRLVKAAEAARAKQLELVQQQIRQLEEGQALLVELRQAELWAALYPQEAATSPFDHQYLLCGRGQKIMPELAGRASIGPLFELLRADADVVAEAASAGQRILLDGRDPRRPADTGCTADADYQARGREKEREYREREHRAGTRWER